MPTEDQAKYLHEIAEQRRENWQMVADLITDGAAMCAEIERLRLPFEGVDNQDWEFLFSVIPDGGRGQFWKRVLAEMRAALER